MSISSIGAPSTPPPVQVAEAAEPKGPEVRNDHDGDDGAAPARSTPPLGQGVRLDTTA